jgi:DNA (cytosine-5)-methyltransferase 1
MANLHQSGQLEPIDNGERAEGVGSPQPSRDSGFWSDHIWLTGSDGKSRRVEPSIPLLAYGIPNRVGRLRAYGNAIVPPLAAEVIKAFMETEA